VKTDSKTGQSSIDTVKLPKENIVVPVFIISSSGLAWDYQ
jgi:hypothetical protein